MIKRLLIFQILLSFVNTVYAQTIDESVDSLLALMSLEEKVGQMTQVERTAFSDIDHLASYGIGSILSAGGSAPFPNTAEVWADMYDDFQRKALESNLGIPLIYGVDAVHGHNNLLDAVIFPHNIGMGCTWNPDLIEEANRIVAKEVIATGIDWTFSPCIAVARDERWGRTYESFGETAEIQKIMSEASVVGLQGITIDPTKNILACAKHFVGDGGTTGGIDQGNTALSESSLRALHMEGYIDAIDVGVGTVMASYNSWNGVKLHGHDYLLTDILKNELGFEGFVISDWKGVDQIDEDYRTAIRRAINAGVDMVMVPDRYEVYINHLISLVNDGEVSVDRIDDAVRRILKQKFRLQLFEKPFTDRTHISDVGSREHRSVARQVVRESVVLLDAKNNILPLEKNNQRVLVAGRLADDLGAQCGGWSIFWQGGNGDITNGTNILNGIRHLSENNDIIYSVNGDHDEDVDLAIVVVGEKTPYAEGAGDRSSLVLDSEDQNLIKELKTQGIPVITVLISGRPMVLGSLMSYSDAILAVWYPGTEGDGIADVLFGDYVPSGLLTHSWPKDMSQVPINLDQPNYDPLFNYKHGLQKFPNAMEAQNLLPFSATTNAFGDQIIFALSDKVTTLDVQLNDFEILVNGIIMSNMFEEISVTEFDESILIFSLKEQLSQGDEILITYTGGGTVSSNALILNSFSDFFVYNSVSGQNAILSIPGKIEAEDFFEMQGIQTEASTDVGGGLNVGYIESGDWMKYNINVEQSGLYTITARVAGFESGTFSLFFDDLASVELDYEATGGWQNWEDFQASVYLEQGNYTMEFRAQSQGFNVNYFEFKPETTSTTQLQNNLSIEVFPNPFNEQITISLNNVNSGRYVIKMIDVTGRYVNELYSGSINTTNTELNFRLRDNLQSGTYFIEVWDGDRRYFEKVVKE